MTTSAERLYRDRAADSSLRLAGHILLTFISVVSVFPFLWMCLNVFKDSEDILRFSLLPRTVTLKNFRDAFSMIPLWGMLKRSFAAAITQTASQLATGIPAAYALSHWNFKGKRLISGILVVSWLIPFQATMVPNYVALVHMGLRDTVLGIVFPNLASAFAILTLLRSFLGFPRTIYDAAEIDGAGSMKVLTAVVLPNLKGAVSSLAVILFINCWNEYFWPLLITRSIEKSTVQIGLRMFMSLEGNLWGPLLAAALITSLPLLILYMLLQKQIIDSFMKSGIK